MDAYSRERGPVTWHINLILISAVDINKKPEFEQQIIDLNDLFIAASFQDHVIAGGFIHLNIMVKMIAEPLTSLLKATFESGGGLLYRIHKAMNRPFDNVATNSYNLFGIRYAHFQKMSLDRYVPIVRKVSLYTE